MKISLKKIGVASALLAGVVAWSGAQAADVSHGVQVFNSVNGNLGGGSTFAAGTAFGSTFTDTFSFDLTGLTTFKQFQVSSIQSKPSANPALVGLDLTGFTLSGPSGLVYSAPTYLQTGVVDKWTLPTLQLNTGHYVVSVSGLVHTGGSLAITGKLVSAVPEPTTYGMMFGGLAVLGLAARRKRFGKSD
jgi:hypothetical protein